MNRSNIYSIFTIIAMLAVIVVAGVAFAAPINAVALNIIADTQCANGRMAKGSCPNGEEYTPPVSAGSFQISDLSYVGGFRISDDQYGAGQYDNAMYSFGGMGINTDRNSVYVAGHEYSKGIAEFAMPALVNSTTLSDLNIATTALQNFSNVLDKDTFDLEGGTGARVAGIYHNNGKLMVTAYSFYAQAPAVDTQFLLFDDANDYANSTHSGWLPATTGTAAAGGWVSPIPAEYQVALGGTHISGFSNSTNRASTQSLSIGPAAYVLNADDVLTNSATATNVATTEIIRYTLANGLVPEADLYNDSRTNDLWTHASEAGYGIIIPGTGVYAVFGRSGMHQSGGGYGVDACGFQGHCALDPTDYQPYYWLYDVDDMIAVRNGTIQPYEITPIDQGVLNVPFQNNSKPGVVGGAFDESQNRLYLMLIEEDTLQGSAATPVVVAYEYAAPTQFQIADMTYEGAFRVNGGTFGSSGVQYSYKNILAINHTTGNLLITGHNAESSQHIGEFEIPMPSTSANIADLPIAANTQPFINVFSQQQFRNTNASESNGIGIYGLYEYNNNIVANYAAYYDSAPFGVDTTLVKRNATDINASTTDVGGAYKWPSAALASGWISPIPSEWQAALGGDHITGFSAGTTRAILSRLSLGPSAYAFNIADVVDPNLANDSTLSHTELMSFPYPNGLGIANTADVDNELLTAGEIWNNATNTEYCFIVPNTSTYMCAGHQAGYNSGLSYKVRNDTSQTDWGDYDAIDADDYRNVYYLFDVNDFVRVRNNEIEPYEIEPYAWGEWDLPFDGSPADGIERVSGAVYDPVTGRYYIAVTEVDNLQDPYTVQPVILVYTLNGGA